MGNGAFCCQARNTKRLYAPLIVLISQFLEPNQNSWFYVIISQMTTPIYFSDDLGNFHSQNIFKSKIFVCRSCFPPSLPPSLLPSPFHSLRIYTDALVALVCGGGRQQRRLWKAPGRTEKFKASLSWKARPSSKAPSPTKPTQTLLGLLVQY